MTVTVKQKNPRALEKIIASRLKGSSLVAAVGYPKELVNDVRYPGKVGKSGSKSKGFSASQMRVTDVAFINEEGSPSRGIPARPFMKKSSKPTSKMVGRENGKLILAMRKKKELTPNVIKAYLNNIGERAAAIHKKTIIDLKSPANKASTIARKKSANPLIDTGLMKNTLTYIVRKKKKGGKK